jgi:hypothetical protein
VSRRHARGAAFVALLLVSSLIFPIVASAAVSAPPAGGDLELQTWPENGDLVAVIALTVPANVKLPATVRLPVPAEAAVQWAGEVLGGDPNLDPSRPYKLKTSPAGGRYAEFTIETTRSAQVDSVLHVLKTNGADVSAAFDWVQSVSSPSVTFSERVPSNATNVRVTPPPVGAPDFGIVGQALYEGNPTQLAPGTKTRVSLAYTSSTTTGTPPAPIGQGESLLYFAVTVLAIVAVILVVVLVRQGQRQASEEEVGDGGENPFDAEMDDAAEESDDGSSRDAEMDASAEPTIDGWSFDAEE